MPRYNSVKRDGGKVLVTIDSVQHTLTVPAFLDLMADALRVIQSIEAQQRRADNGHS